MSKYLVGRTYPITTTFTDALGVPIAVTSVTFKVYDSNQVQIGTTVSITDAYKISTGVYTYNYIFPNNLPYIVIKWEADAGLIHQLSADKCDLEWYETDIEDLPALTLTVGVDSYVTLAETTTAIVSQFNTQSWDNASDNDRIRAILQATKNIDSLRLQGVKLDLTQTLEFPRYYPNTNPSCYMGYYASGVPDKVKLAVYQEVLAVLNDVTNPATNMRLTLQQQGVTRIVTGDAEEQYNGSGASSDQLLSPSARTLMRQYIAHTTKISRQRGGR